MREGTRLHRLATWYSTRSWLNVPVMLLLLPFAAAAVVVRAAALRILRKRDIACDRWKVLCLSHVPWNHIWQRNHHTMARLARRGHPVLYLHPMYLHLVLKWPVSLTKVVDHGDVEGVVPFRPMMLPGMSRLPMVDRVNSWLLSCEAIGRGCSRDLVLWYYYPTHESLRRTLPHRAAVYDIQDEYSAFAWAARNVVEAEKRLLAECDVTFPGTHALYERKQPANGNSHFYACGVEVEHFAQARTTPAGNDRRRTLGYFGAIDKRIDAELLAAMADRHPEWHIVMVGPIADKEFAPPRRDNLEFTGGRPYKQLPAIMREWDVALMPWALNELTMHINPTKTLEYFAARKPVVATAIPDLKKFYADVAYLAETHEEFVALCEKVLAGDPQLEERLERGCRMADQVSWETIIGEMEQFVDEAIARREGR